MSTKRKFEMIGVGDTKVKVTVDIQSPKTALTRQEVIRMKNQFENSIHATLREAGYDVKDIRLKG